VKLAQLLIRVRGFCYTPSRSEKEHPKKPLAAFAEPPLTP
jgi:hypothetical protein